MTKDYNPCPGLFRRHSEAIMNMGLTAEYLAAKYRIPRGRQDEFALRSHQLADQATDAGEFRPRVIPTWGRDDAGQKVLLDRRPVHPARHLAREPCRRCRRPSSPTGGSVTAGNSSPINVGAAAVLMMSEEKAAELGLKPHGEGPRHGSRRRQSRGDGNRPGPGHSQGAEASRPDSRQKSSASS